MNVENLLIEQACSRLMIDFISIVDAQDYERLRDLFTENATMARPSDPSTAISGLDNIMSAFLARPRNRLSQHLCTNIQITVDSPDRAHGTCVLVLYTADAAEPAVPGKGRKASPGAFIGAYDDEFVRTPSGWRIRARRGRMTFHL